MFFDRAQRQIWTLVLSSIVIFEGVRTYSYLFSPFSLPSPNSPIDRTQKKVQSAGFYACFSYGNTVVPMAHAVHSKMLLRLLQIFLPKKFECFFPSTPGGLKSAYYM